MRPQSIVLIWLAAEILGPLLFGAAIVLVWLKGRRRWSVAVLAALIVLEANLSAIPFTIGLKNLFPVYDHVSSDGGFVARECFRSTSRTRRIPLTARTRQPDLGGTRHAT